MTEPTAAYSVTAATPTAPGDRAVTLDALRGVAILGILLLNVRTFALPGVGYQYPFSTPASTADLWTFALTSILAQNKFITIFATLYGAGILLATRRADAAGQPAFGTFGRRSMILAGIGLLHMFLIWHGDILFAYALIGLVAFTMRRLSSQWLWTVAAIGYLITSLFFVLLALLMWAGVEFGDQSPEMYIGGGEAARLAEIDAYRGGYLSELKQRTFNAVFMLPFLLIVFSPYLLGLMLAGMALMRSGFLTGEWSSRRYVVVGLTGLVVGVGGTAVVTGIAANAGWPIVGWMGFGQALLVILTPPAALGIASLWIGHVAAGRTPWLARAFAATGRMAFTNYLAQSIAGALFFYTFNHFGSIGYFGQLVFVGIVWAVQLTWSVLWLSRFRYGPLEWLWRAATYGQLPRMRRDQIPVASLA